VRSVLITGAGRGFGRALFGVYARRGWRLFPLVRDPGAAQTLSAAAEPCHPIVGDVAAPETAREIARVLDRHGGSLDLLINNAGNIRKTEGVLNMTPEEMEEHFRVHCAGAFRCTRAALPFLERAPRPTVVNVTSRWGTMAWVAGNPPARAHAYCIAKSALNMLTVCLDQALKPRGIRVVAVHPGRLRTDAAPPDADTDPAEAAARLAEWLETLDLGEEGSCHDLMSGETIPW